MTQYSFAPASAPSLTTPGGDAGITFNGSAPDKAERLPVTIFRNHSGLLTKHVDLDEGGVLRISPSAQLARGEYQTVLLENIEELAATIANLQASEALAFGIARSGQTQGVVTTKAHLDSSRDDGAVARTKEFFGWPDGPGLLMLDVDLKEALERLPKLRDRQTIPGLREVLLDACPALNGVPMLGMPSASAFIFRRDNHEQLRGLTGARFYVPVARASDIPVIGHRLHERLVSNGYGYVFVSRAGRQIVRSPIDTSVWSPERLDFIGGAHCGAGVIQDRGAPQVWNRDSNGMLSLEDVRPLTDGDRSGLTAIATELLAKSEAEAKRVHRAWAAARYGSGRAVSVVWSPASWRSGSTGSSAGAGAEPVAILRGDHEIILSDGFVVSVDDILADRERFHNQTCYEPLEPEYGDEDPRIARIYTLGQTTGPAIHSFAHGGSVYLLHASAAMEFSEGQRASNSAPALAQRVGDDNDTDVGNSRRFARVNGGRLMYAGDSWLRWDGARWLVADEVDMEQEGKAVVRTLWEELGSSSDPDRRKRLANWAMRSESRPRIQAMVALARGEMRVPTAEVNRDHYLLSVANGTIDLRTGVLGPHRPTDYITKIAPVMYDARAICPRWLAFLERIFDGDADLIAGVQRAVGYTLSGSTAEQVLFLAYGTGANGKSTFLETMRALLGDYGLQASFATFLERRGDGPRSDIARLDGARFVAATEAGREKNWDEVIVKSLTGGDTVTARYLYREEFEFKPAFKLWLAANHLPKFSGDDPALWRRIRVIPFNVTVPPDERDPALLDKLRAELPGILNWAVQGCVDWQRVGLAEPIAVKKATATYRAESSDIAAFIQECCVIDAGLKTPARDLYQAYCAWRNKREELLLSPPTERSFSVDLARFDPGRVTKKKSSIIVWHGLGLRPDSTADGDTASTLRTAAAV